MRLIDVQDILEAVKALPVELDAETVQRCIEILSNRPTVDAVPVIRCKDCKYAKQWRDTEWFDCTADNKRLVKPTGFCSWAERK